MPEQPDWLANAALLTQEQRLALLETFVRELGIDQIRITGGEPLLHPQVIDFIKSLQALRAYGLKRISLTSNGILLPRRAAALRSAGLDDVNVSLDALSLDTFRKLSGGRSSPAEVISGIDAARDSGLAVKINTVAIRGTNEDQILPLLHWAMARNLPLRFIEFMPLDGQSYWSRDRVVPSQDILARISKQHEVTALPRDGSPAAEYRIENGYRFGLISTVTEPFCGDCDRLRLSADGHLYTCLFSAKGQDLRPVLSESGDDAALLTQIRDAVWNKPRGYVEHSGYVERPITMHTLGG